MVFIGDGTKLASYPGSHTTCTTRIHDIVGWMVDQDDKLLFWVLHREDLCLPHIVFKRCVSCMLERN